MLELSQIKYSRLREYLDCGFKRMSIKKDPLEYLLSMETAESIQALVSKYNTIYNRLSAFKIYPFHSYEEYFLFDDLSLCFNENLLRLFKEIKEPTKDDVIYFLANLRVGPSVQPIQEKILNISGVDKKDISDIINARDCQYEIRRKIEKKDRFYLFNSHSLLWGYKMNTKKLVSCKRIFDVADNKIVEGHGMSYEKLIAEIEEDEESNRRLRIYQEEEERKEEERRKLNEKKRQEAKENRKILFKIIAIMTPFMVAGIALICYLENKYPTQFEQAEKIGKIVSWIFLLGLYIYSIKDEIIERLKQKS